MIEPGEGQRRFTVVVTCKVTDKENIWAMLYTGNVKRSTSYWQGWGEFSKYIY